MKKQIRLETFETNSSSIHTLQISQKHMHKSKLKIADDGYVHISLTEYYGKDEKDYKGQREKLTYIVTWMYIYFGCNLDELIDSYIWKNFCYEFSKYVNNTKRKNSWYQQNCHGVWIDQTITGGNGEGSYDYLDHQSMPYGKYDAENCIVDLYDTEQLINFIFNPYLWLHTDCD